MTLQSLYTFIDEYKSVVLLALLFLPWLSLGICMAVPGDREEPAVLNFNLSMAFISLLMSLGYIWYATSTQDWNQVMLETDLLLLGAPFYYVGISLWITKQRVPLASMAVYRAVQGLALIGAGYLGLSWIMSKMRILVFSYLPFPILLMLILALVGLVYLGYLKIMDAEGGIASPPRTPRNPPPRTPSGPASPNIEDELEALRKDLEK